MSNTPSEPTERVLVLVLWGYFYRARYTRNACSAQVYEEWVILRANLESILAAGRNIDDWFVDDGLRRRSAKGQDEGRLSSSKVRSTNQLINATRLSEITPLSTQDSDSGDKVMTSDEDTREADDTSESSGGTSGGDKSDYP